MLVHITARGVLSATSIYGYQVGNFVTSITGQLSKPSETVPGFQMHSEDFPALPGSAAKTSGNFNTCILVCYVSF